MTPLCPRCGHNFEADRPVYRDGWMVNPRGLVAFRGPTLSLRATWAAILHAIAASEDFITADALLNRVSSSEDPKIIQVHICRLRKWLAEQGLPDPIQSGRKPHGGYRWVMPTRDLKNTPVHEDNLTHA